MYLFAFFNVILIAYHVYAIDAYNKSTMLEKVFFWICDVMTSLRYGRIFCLEFQKIDGTEYLMGSTELAIFWKLLNLEAWNLVGVYKIENK